MDKDEKIASFIVCGFFGLFCLSIVVSLASAVIGLLTYLS